MRRLAVLLLALLPALPAARGAPAPRPPRPPPLAYAAKKELAALFERYFTAKEEEKGEILAAVRKHDPIPESAAKQFTKDLLARAKKGVRLEDKARATFADPAFPGEYMLSGASGGKVKGLVIGLHGGGEGVGDPSEAAQKWQAASSMDCVVILPKAIDLVQTAWNKEKNERFVLALIEAAKRTFPIDTNRVFLVGHSMGGYGTWSIGGHNADLFAAISPNAGGIYVMAGEDRKIVGHTPGVLANLHNTPIWFTHGDDDKQVWVGPDRYAAEQLAKLKAEHPDGYDSTYKEYPGIGHGLPPDGSIPILKWLTAHKRRPYPKKVVWEPAVSWRKSFAWLRKEKPEGGPIIAENKGGNLFEVKAEGNPGDLSILLSEEMADLDKPVVVKLNGTEVYHDFALPSAATLLECIAGRNDPAMVFTARIDLGGTK
ncbi:MAG: prolyl oligopeptidase family serine peptidase [Planctomycetes bacterium]|nr:prolyl oligopeptidase family serine peptidase [Planctomycetota bacterium]